MKLKMVELQLEITVQMKNPGGLSSVQDLQELAYKLVLEGLRGKVNPHREDVGLTAVVTPYGVLGHG